MQISIKNVLLVLSVVCATQPLFAQQKKEHLPFYQQIQDFVAQDKQHFPEKNQILFIGSSSFAKWTDVQDYFPNYYIINRGFGGSTFPDLMNYVDDVVWPYKPRQIVIYCGDNDAAGKGITADSIFNRFQKFYKSIRKHLPEKTQITYVSIKPSPSREKFFPVMDKANWEIENYLKTKKHADYVDVWHWMLDDQGLPRKELFGPDMLHMNAKGYMIWQNAILPHLKK